MTIAIIIPAFKESDNIEKLICSLIKFECQYEMLELYEKLDAKVLFIFANIFFIILFGHLSHSFGP